MAAEELEASLKSASSESRFTFGKFVLRKKLEMGLSLHPPLEETKVEAVVVGGVLICLGHNEELMTAAGVDRWFLPGCGAQVSLGAAAICSVGASGHLFSYSVARRDAAVVGAER